VLSDACCHVLWQLKNAVSRTFVAIVLLAAVGRAKIIIATRVISFDRRRPRPPQFGMPGESGLNGLLSSEAFALHLKL
jgi:hypothetical protein